MTIDRMTTCALFLYLTHEKTHINGISDVVIDRASQLARLSPCLTAGIYISLGAILPGSWFLIVF